MKNEILVLHDQHLHTEYSEDSKAKIEDYIVKAIEAGCSYFAMTDHLDFDVAERGKTWIADYKKQKEELNILQNKYNIKLLQGIEIGYKAQYKQEIKSIVDSLDFDVINLSIHDYKKFDFYWDEPFIDNGAKEMVKLYLDLYIEAVKSDMPYQVVCHIDYAYKSAIRVEPSLKFSSFKEQIIEIMNAIIKNGKAYEVNTKVLECIPHAEEHLKYLLDLYKSLGGVDLTLSSDAHDVKRFRSSFDRYMKIIKEAGFDKLCYFINKEKHYYYI